MISQLPRWVWYGSALLAFIAGMINAVGFMGFQHQGVTHLTGTTTLLAMATATGDTQQIAHLFAIVASFLLGCILSGIVVQDKTLKIGRPYGYALAIESLMLFAAVPLLHQNLALGAYLASCACGFQNGVVSTYSGALLRTTHVSGVITDLGIFLGHFLRRLPVNKRRGKLSAVLLGSFFVGGVAGALGFEHLSYDTIYLPASLLGLTGVGYLIFLKKSV